jgi:hypothetical protein
VFLRTGSPTCSVLSRMLLRFYRLAARPAIDLLRSGSDMLR